MTKARRLLTMLESLDSNSVVEKIKRKKTRSNIGSRLPWFWYGTYNQDQNQDDYDGGDAGDGGGE